MMLRKVAILFLVAVTATMFNGTPVPAAESDKPVIEPLVEELLKETSNYLKSAEQFTFLNKRTSIYAVWEAPSKIDGFVDKLPDAVRPALYKNDSKTYTYYYGTFFAEENGRFKVVVPPAGTLVGFIPDGYTETGEEGAMTYQFAEAEPTGTLW